MISEETRSYEIFCLIKAASEEEAIRTFGCLRKYIEDENGIIVEEGRLAKRRLSYLTKKESEAYTGHFKFLARPEAASRLKELIDGEKAILRYIIVKSRHKDYRKAPSAKIRRAPEKKEAELVELDKKLEEILGK
jgi:ribosomal protein S6